MIQASAFIEHLRGLHYSQFAGVPCSFLKPFINYVIDDATLDYVGAASEGEAVGFTLGAWLAGRKTVTMCQNSGLGNMVNPLTSLNYPFRVPTLLITTWRGQPGVKDEPQHEQMGRIMHQLLDTLEIPWLPFPTDEADIPGVMAAAEASMAERQRPFALVMSQDSVAPHKLTRRVQMTAVQTEVRHHPAASANARLTRTAALQIILESLTGQEAVVATTGMTGRELFTLADQPNHLYVVGGMGTASAIGFGIAHALPHQPVVVLDGDGAALMKLGSLATIGCYQPRNLLHVILDTESHDSTGGQQTSSPITRFAEIAAAANYQRAFTADRPEDVRQCLQYLRTATGPSLLHVKIQPGSPKEIGRPKVKPHEVKERFMDFLRAANPPQTPDPRPHAPNDFVNQPDQPDRAPDKLLFTPGPLTTSLTVKQAMLHDAGSRDPSFIKLVRDIRGQLLQLGGVSREAGYEAVLMQGSGTAGVESVISSALPHDGKLLVIVNGAYGERIVTMAARHGIPATVLRQEEDQLPSVNAIEAALQDDLQITHVAAVHCETTTGILNPIAAIGKVVKRHHREFIVDAMSSFGAIPLNLAEAGVDYLISSANKCIEGVPGFAFVLARREALLASEGRARTLSLDLLAQWKGLEQDGQFRFTPPTHALLAFAQALQELAAEGGVAGRGARYRANHVALLQGMKALGFRTYLASDIQSFIITTFHYPADPKFVFEQFYQRLFRKGFVIYPGKLTRLDCFRIGNIGRLHPADIQSLLTAIAAVLKEMGLATPLKG